MEKKKKKERTYELVGYRKTEHKSYKEESANYLHYIPVSFGELKGKKLEERYSVGFDELEDLYLSRATPSFPTELNSLGYIDVDNYVLDFWGYILSPLELQVLLTLIRWSYRKGFTTIPLTELSDRLGKGRVAVRNAIETLEDNYFLIRVHRIHKNPKAKDGKVGGGNPDGGIFIRLRGTTPLLSQEQVDTLPEFLRVEHEYIVEKINKALLEDIDYKVKPFQKKFVRDFIAEKCKSEETLEKDISFLVKKHGILELVEPFVSIDHELNSMLKEKIENMISKPSYEVFFKDTVFYLENHGEVLTAICQDEYVAERVNSNPLLSVVESVFENVEFKTGIRIAGFNAYSFSRYYKSMYRNMLS